MNVFVGSSTVANSGNSRSIRLTPNGNTPILKIDDLSKIFLIAASGTGNEVVYLAGSR